MNFHSGYQEETTLLKQLYFHNESVFHTIRNTIKLYLHLSLSSSDLDSVGNQKILFGN